MKNLICSYTYFIQLIRNIYLRQLHIFIINSSVYKIYEGFRFISYAIYVYLDFDYDFSKKMSPFWYISKITYWQ